MQASREFREFGFQNGEGIFGEGFTNKLANAMTRIKRLFDNHQPDFMSIDGFQYKNQDPIRKGFIKKVYGILLSQLLLTTLICATSFFPRGKAFFGNEGVFGISVLIIFISCMLICYGKGISRQVPLNYFLLFSFTIGESFLVASVCAQFKAQSVILAAVISCCLVATLTVYTFMGKGFAILNAIVFIFLASLIIVGVLPFALQLSVLNVLFPTMGCFGFVVYIIVDTQLIIDGYAHKIDLDDYILGAMLLYLDIIYLFIRFLRGIGKKNEEEQEHS